MGRLSLAVAEIAVGAGRAIARALPDGVRKNLEDRVFYAIFQRTRVENDAYGWKPPPPGPAPEDHPGRPPPDKEEEP